LGSREGSDPTVATRRREADASILKGSEGGVEGEKEGVMDRKVREEGREGGRRGKEGGGGGRGGRIGWSRQVCGRRSGTLLKGGCEEKGEGVGVS
jgi:hypothetical protein